MNIRGDRRLEDEEWNAEHVMRVWRAVAACGKVLSTVGHVLNVVNYMLAKQNVPYGRGFAEHFRDAKDMAVRTRWGGGGAHYRHEHHQAFYVTSFKPFAKARVLAIENSLPSRRLMEATEIRLKKPSANSECGWHLTD